MLSKKTVYDNLVTKVNDIDTRKFFLNKKSQTNWRWLKEFLSKASLFQELHPSHRGKNQKTTDLV